MSSREPPWRNDRSRHDQRNGPASSIPAKRSADSRAYESASKRSTNAAEEAWVADEDRFVLQQAKKKAALRVKGGRAKPIDWLAVTLRFIDPTEKSILDEEVEDHELDVVDPEGVLEGLNNDDLAELEKEIENYLTLETSKSNRDYWNSLKVICKDIRRKSKTPKAEARGTSSVAADIDQLLAPKSYEQLEALEVQVKKKLDSDEPIDYDYWEQLLRSLRVWKAKAKLRRVSQEIVKERLQTLRKQQAEAAASVQGKIYTMLKGNDEATELQPTTVVYDAAMDPEPMLKLRTEDKALPQSEEKSFLEHVTAERRKIQKIGYVPSQTKASDTAVTSSQPTASQAVTTSASRFAPVEKEDYSKATMALYEREVARGVEEGEEVFNAEEEVTTARPQSDVSYKPRKPRYFNRVQMGYEWNKYNQTHYDHDNPPPKVVQGYKFNIFYPDLIDKSKAPTYKIEREHGRKKGQSFAPAGEDDTCLIRFIAGPPYEDIAFRIVDKEWDYSAKRERGFKSSFDKGILQLHFQFKKSPHRPCAEDAYSSFDTVPSSESSVCAHLPRPLRVAGPVPSQSSSTLSVDEPSLPTVADSNIYPSEKPRMNFDEQQRTTWPAPAGLVFNPVSQGGSTYPGVDGFASGPNTYQYHYTHNGLAYDGNYKLAYPVQYSNSNCPRSYNGIDLSSLPHNLAVTDSFPPNAYHIEPPSHQDAMDLSDHEIKSQLMQLSNDYDHSQYACPKVEDHSYCHSPYDSHSQVSTPHDESLRYAHDIDPGEGGTFDREQPYAQLIYQALLNAPGHTMILRDIYEWFKNNTDKASASETKGWQNSIRHNLSMNGAFEKVDQPGDDARRGFMWRLTEQAVREGVKSTTRYRSKQPNKRSHRTQQPQPQRQASGAKGGQAARRSAKLKRSARLQEAYLNPQPMSRSVPASFDPSYHRHGLPTSIPPSPYNSSEADFCYSSQNGDFPHSPTPDDCSTMDLFSPTASYMSSPMSHGMPIADTGYLLHQSPNDSLFTNSPSPSADEPRTPLNQGVWQDDVAMGTSCVFDGQLVYRENAS
ncbi:hypothetical protein yc1106_03560 [Curvularia clavata]|uniref:Splicing factor Cactin n=1 Tax=Curvularia clavata TaxID=95742 RepID=A0A9Q8Z4R8_CURCL|nr:hypothetical protein yc1106_03560 [Curvularia clavata]